MSDELVGDQNPSYEELAEQVGKLELEASERQLTTIGIGQTMDPKEEIQEVRSYQELVRLITAFEAKKASASKKSALAGEQQVVQAVQTAQKKMGVALPYIEKEAKSARDELAKIVGHIKMPKLELGGETQKQRKEQLVLPNLTVSDQIGELEKIITGAGSNAFDDEHIGIIKKEVDGLKAMVAKERKLYAKGRLKMPDPASALWELRNSRLDEAAAALRM